MRLSRSLPTLLIASLAGWGCTQSDSTSSQAAAPELLKNTYCAGGYYIREPGAANKSQTMLRIHFPNGEESGGVAVLENVRVRSWSAPPLTYPFYERHYGVDKELPVQVVSSPDELKNAEADEKLKLFAYFDSSSRSGSPSFLSKEEFLKQMGRKTVRYDYLTYDRSLKVAVRSQKSDFTFPYISFVPCESYGAPSLRMKGTPGDELEYGLLYSDSRFADSNKNRDWANNIRVLRPQLPIRFTTMTLVDLERESWCKMDSDLEVYTFRNGKVASSNFLLPYFDQILKQEIRFAEFAAPTKAGDIKITNSGLPSLSLGSLQIYTDAKNLEYVALADRNSGYHITSYYVVRCSDPRLKQLNPKVPDWVKTIRNLHLEKL